MDEKGLREKISKIQKDTTLTEIEKTRKIQELFYTSPTSSSSSSSSSSSTSKGINQGKQTPKEGEDEEDEESEEEIREREKDSYHSDGLYGCEHYLMNCKIKAECCKKWFNCRQCHDEYYNASHTLDRYTTKTMMCQFCKTVQPVSNCCVKCDKKIAEYYCNVCKLWESRPEREIYHCNDCRICRVGSKTDNFHCYKCSCCFSVSLQKTHKCLPDAMKSNCPICKDFLFTSTKTVSMVETCGHPIHSHCFSKHLETSFQCPVCLKSVFRDMSRHWLLIEQEKESILMPDSLKDKISVILCNDCERKGNVQYHIDYHKCEHCGSYNTSVLRIMGLD